MSKKHPCRKIVLNKMDQLILGELENNKYLSLHDALELTGLHKEQLVKRLRSLHKHKLLRFYKNTQKVAMR